jgi:hypothetical protein
MRFITARLESEGKERVREQLQTRFSDLDPPHLGAIRGHRGVSRRESPRPEARPSAGRREAAARASARSEERQYGISDGRATTQIPKERIRIREQKD